MAIKVSVQSTPRARVCDNDSFQVWLRSIQRRWAEKGPKLSAACKSVLDFLVFPSFPFVLQSIQGREWVSAFLYKKKNGRRWDEHSRRDSRNYYIFLFMKLKAWVVLEWRNHKKPECTLNEYSTPLHVPGNQTLEAAVSRPANELVPFKPGPPNPWAQKYRMRWDSNHQPHETNAFLSQSIYLWLLFLLPFLGVCFTVVRCRYWRRKKRKKEDWCLITRFRVRPDWLTDRQTDGRTQTRTLRLLYGIQEALRYTIHLQDANLAEEKQSFKYNALLVRLRRIVISSSHETRKGALHCTGRSTPFLPSCPSLNRSQSFFPLPSRFLSSTTAIMEIGWCFKLFCAVMSAPPSLPWNSCSRVGNRRRIVVLLATIIISLQTRVVGCWANSWMGKNDQCNGRKCFFNIYLPLATIVRW